MKKLIVLTIAIGFLSLRGNAQFFFEGGLSTIKFLDNNDDKMKYGFNAAAGLIRSDIGTMTLGINLFTPSNYTLNKQIWNGNNVEDVPFNLRSSYFNVDLKYTRYIYGMPDDQLGIYSVSGLGYFRNSQKINSSGGFDHRQFSDFRAFDEKGEHQTHIVSFNLGLGFEYKIDKGYVFAEPKLVLPYFYYDKFYGVYQGLVPGWQISAGYRYYIEKQ